MEIKPRRWMKMFEGAGTLESIRISLGKGCGETEMNNKKCAIAQAHLMRLNVVLR